LTYGFLVGKAREARSRASAAEHALGTMSHEIRSPLSAIIRFSEALRTDHMNNLTAAQRAGIAQINADAVELLELTVQRLAAVVRETTPETPASRGGALSGPPRWAGATARRPRPAAPPRSTGAGRSPRRAS